MSKKSGKAFPELRAKAEVKTPCRNCIDLFIEDSKRWDTLMRQQDRVIGELRERIRSGSEHGRAQEGWPEVECHVIQ